VAARIPVACACGNEVSQRCHWSCELKDQISDQDYLGATVGAGFAMEKKRFGP